MYVQVVVVVQPGTGPLYAALGSSLLAHSGASCFSGFSFSYGFGLFSLLCHCVRAIIQSLILFPLGARDFFFLLLVPQKSKRYPFFKIWEEM